MPSIRVKKELNSGIYFFTLMIQNAYYILDRHNRWDILARSLLFFQENRGLKIHSFVFMINHLHLITESPDTIAFIRDFKKFTTREILKNIEQTEPRILKLFVKPGQPSCIWTHTNMPERVESEKFYLQKVNYIQNNPVKRNYVAKPEDWYWSSANPNCPIDIDYLYS